tara:strand:- start:124 stop:453 length:330 start_codon:yes stop_codon:yes gene_type:complete
LSTFDIDQELSSAFSEETSEEITAPKLALYMTSICPFCIYVRSAISALGLDVEMRNIHEEQHFNDLIAARNQATVPVLRITYPSENKEENWLAESMDIVKYLKELKQAG